MINWKYIGANSNFSSKTFPWYDFGPKDGQFSIRFFGFSSIFTNVSWCQTCLLDLRWNVLVHHFQFRKTFWNFWHDRFLKTFGATVQYCGVCSLFVSEWGWQHKELFLRLVNPKETSRKKQAFQVWLNVVVKDSTQKLWFLVGGL